MNLCKLIRKKFRQINFLLIYVFGYFLTKQSHKEKLCDLSDLCGYFKILCIKIALIKPVGGTVDGRLSSGAC